MWALVLKNVNKLGDVHVMEHNACQLKAYGKPHTNVRRMWPLVMTNVKETGRLINRATTVIISPLDGKVSVHDFNTCILALFRQGSKQQ